MITNLKHIYIHVPFCSGKCSYCAFYSVRYSSEFAHSYLNALEKEIELINASGILLKPETIYLGGGTPSLLSTDQLDRLCRILLNHSEHDQLLEWTIEANPGNLSADKIQMLIDHGINRVSIGAQSFNDPTLQELGRRHNASDIEQTVNMLRSAGMNNIGLDLIACLPGIADNEWRNTLQEALRLKPEHLSVYSLSAEEGTAIDNLVKSNRMSLLGPDAELDVLELTEQILESSGYVRYETSNYATPGRECRHNLSSWQGCDYLGLGPSASSRLGLLRRKQGADLAAYCQALDIGSKPPAMEHSVSPEMDATERMLFHFRLKKGVDLQAFCQQFEPPAAHLIEQWRETLVALEQEGLISRSGGRWTPTSRGRNLSDFIATRLL